MSGEFQRISELFDELVDLPEDELTQRLTELDEPLADRLRAMIDVDRGEQRLLDEGAHVALDGDPPDQDRSRRVGAYALGRRLGSGGMGEVFVAERADGQFHQKVALKILHDHLASSSSRDRFVNERQILADLTHPHIARLLDGGVLDDGRPWFAMEYVEGSDLRTWALEHRPCLDDKLDLFTAVCDAVHFAHARLIVHRDIKPDNVLVDIDGEPRLVDFGIAKVLEPTFDGAETRDGDRLMTPTWAAPEQMRGEPVTTAADVYALGAVLYELLCEAHVHAGARSLRELETIVCERTPPPPSSVLSDAGGERLHDDLDRICLKALRKEPERRYLSAQALADDIRRFQRGLPVTAAADTATYRLGKFVRRHRRSVVTATTFLLLLAGLVGAFTWQLAEERDRARAEADKARQVAEFLREVFASSNPASARGRDVTARELLDDGARRIGALDDQPEVQAELLTTMGQSYLSLGELDAGVALLERALAVRRTYPGHQSRDLVQTQLALGRGLRQAGRYDDAGPHLEAAESRARTWQGSRLTWAAIRHESGLLAREQGDLDGARRALEDALGARTTELPGNHPSIGDSHHALANLAFDEGDLDATETHYRIALQIYADAFGEKHPSTAMAMNDLAYALRHQDRFDEAEKLYQRALTLGRELFGDEHPEVALTLNHIARLRYKQGRFDEAEKPYREALAIRVAVYGEDHAAVAASMSGLAGNLREQGELDEAERLYRRSLEMLTRLLGKDHPFVAAATNSVAGILAAQERYEEAETMYRTSLAMHDAVLPEGHPKGAYPRLGLGEVLVELARPRQARPLLERALTLRTKALGEDHIDVAVVKSALGACLTVLGEIGLARQLLEAAQRTFETRLSAEHRYRTTVNERLADLDSPAYTRSILSDRPVVHLSLPGSATSPSKVDGADGARSLADESLEIETEGFGGDKLSVELWVRGARGEFLAWCGGGRTPMALRDVGRGLVVVLGGDERQTDITLDDDWHHLGIRWDVAKGAVSVAVDGEIAWSEELAPQSPLPPNGVAALGGDAGYVDELAVYNRLIPIQRWADRAR